MITKVTVVTRFVQQFLTTPVKHRSNPTATTILGATHNNAVVCSIKLKQPNSPLRAFGVYKLAEMQLNLVVNAVSSPRRGLPWPINSLTTSKLTLPLLCMLES